MENIKLINRCAAAMSPVEKEKQQFLFWSEFFMEATDSDQEIVCGRFPVLIQEVTKVRLDLLLYINISRYKKNKIEEIFLDRFQIDNESGAI